VPPFSNSNNWLHSCRPSIAEKHETNNQQEQSWALLTVWYDIHMSIQSMRQPNLGPTNLETKQLGCMWRHLPVLPILQKQHKDWSYCMRE
jgi:hypothetical protein